MAAIAVAAKYILPYVGEKVLEKAWEHVRDGNQRREMDQGSVMVPEQTWDQTVASAHGWAEPTGPHGMKGLTYSRLPGGQWLAAGDGRVSVGTGSPEEIGEMVTQAQARKWQEVTLGGEPDFQRKAQAAFEKAGIKVVPAQEHNARATGPRLGM